MGSPVTPEKIKSVLSSFLLKAETPKSKLDSVNTPDKTTSIQKNTSGADDTPSKSNTAKLRSHDSFLKRLDTFSARTWFGKPTELSPLICARYGWENVECDMLQCAGCKAFLSGKLPMKSDVENYKQSLEKLKKNIVLFHDRFCVLGTFPCPEEFCHVQVDDVASLSSSFFERVSALSEIQDHLPRLNLTDLEDLGYDQGQAGAYCKRNLVPDKDISPTAVTLAFTGWTCCSSNKDILMCVMCRRKIGLWNFTTGSNHDLEESSSDDADGKTSEDMEPKTKRRKFATSPKKEVFNPVEEHNHWCPWIQRHRPSSKSSASVNLFSSPPPSATALLGSRSEQSPRLASSPLQSAMSSKTPVFIAALKSIAPGLMDNNTGLAAGMKRSPMMEGLRCFRRALETWSSPRANLDDSLQANQSSVTLC